jgi:serine/threonine-protein kinase
MSDTVVISGGHRREADFGKYQYIADLGEGAMGKVCKCFDPDFHRMVAVKTIHKSLLADGAADEFRDRFRNEMRAVGKLTHPNIVSVYDAGEKDGCPYFVMEYIEGHELKHMLDEGAAFGVDQSISIIKGVLRGLSCVHSHGITHRDLKPANIFISDRDGSVKIADFGIAKLDNSEMTQIGTVIGSPKYMSPEQCMGEPVDARSDIFAIGIIFYELLTAHYCFSGDSTSAITQKIINVDPEPPSRLNAAIPRHLDQVIKKALSKRPGDRFQSAQAFLDAIDHGLRQPATKPLMKYAMISVVCVTLLVAAGLWLAAGKKGSGLSQVAQPGESAAAQQPVVMSADNADTGQAADRASMPVGPVSSMSDKSPAVQPLSPEKSAKIAKLYKVAETYVKIGRLVSPAGSNAFDAYSIILSMDPSNEQARAGIAEIERMLLSNAQASLDEGDVAQALIIARAGQEIFPASVRFSGLIRSLESR